MERRINKRMLVALTVVLLLSAMIMNRAWAWYPNYGYPQPPYYPYTYNNWQGYPGYWSDGENTGWYGYAQPQWYFRGRMNRYGDYRIDFRLRNISMFDMYTLWMLANNGY